MLVKLQKSPIISGLQRSEEARRAVDKLDSRTFSDAHPNLSSHALYPGLLATNLSVCPELPDDVVQAIIPPPTQTS